jgi:MoxR-like ATPase
MDPAERNRRWPEPPHWRAFSGGPDLPPPPPADEETARVLGDVAAEAVIEANEVSRINAAIYLRRPLLVTGPPGSGKSSLAHRISRELGLGRVLHWPITSRATLKSGQYDYDAIGRAQAVGPRWVATMTAGPERTAAIDREDEQIGDFIHLGPLGTALLPHRLPRVLLIDEMDKSDIDLPNDLLNVFEEGQFVIPELLRVRNHNPEVTVHTADAGSTAVIRDGVVRCNAFPIVVITSNGEREFPPAFRRRTIMLELGQPSREKLAAMVAAHFPSGIGESADILIGKFLERTRGQGGLAADQLLSAVQLAANGVLQPGEEGDWDRILDTVWHRLSPVVD